MRSAVRQFGNQSISIYGEMFSHNNFSFFFIRKIATVNNFMAFENEFQFVEHTTLNVEPLKCANVQLHHFVMILLWLNLLTDSTHSYIPEKKGRNSHWGSLFFMVVVVVVFRRNHYCCHNSDFDVSLRKLFVYIYSLCILVGNRH